MKKETDAASKERLQHLIEEIEGLEAKSRSLTAMWRAEKQKIDDAQKLKERIDQAKIEVEQAQRNGNFARAGELTYSVIPDLTRQLAEAEQAAEHRMLNEVVKEEDIAGVVSRWTGIPVDKMLTGEREKLLKMEQVLSGRVIGQAEAVRAVSNAVQAGPRRPAGPQPPDRLLPDAGADRRRQDGAVQGPGRASCSTMTRRWCGSTCRSSWRSMPVSRLIGAPPGLCRL